MGIGPALPLLFLSVTGGTLTLAFGLFPPGEAPYAITIGVYSLLSLSSSHFGAISGCVVRKWADTTSSGLPSLLEMG